mmetsp:Transcript_62005/g.110244  ORF Transcript_62005/g.110244 Transcript_62005/m.110244 type:complete len:311 (-) Transcript_62005:27-959(-)
MKPRWQDLGNAYHDMEAVFGLFQTADVLNKSLDHYRVLLVFGDTTSKNSSGFLDLIQLAGQVHHDGVARLIGNQSGFIPKMLPQLLEFWSQLVHRQDESKFKLLPSSVSRAGGLCFTGKVVLPIHACSGEVLTRSWSSAQEVRKESPLAMRYVHRILQAFNLDDAPKLMRGPKTVLLLVRRKTRVRQMREEDAMELASMLQKQCGAIVDIEDFAEIPYAEQVRRSRQSHLMISTHGAGMIQCMFLADGGGLLEITPWGVPWAGKSVANIWMNLAAWTRKDYLMVHGQSRGTFLEFNKTAVLASAKKLLRC